MSELPLKEAIKILTQEKKKVELKLAKAYDSFCLYPNERDQNDWDRFSALDSAFEMAISALEKLKNSNKEVKKSNDLIGRQDAIDAVTHITSSMSVCVNADECHGMKRMQRQAVIELANLPSAQPEHEYTMEEYMYGQDMGNPEDGSL